ncbi:cytochrome P450 [Halenospora varia]|nr:cytochrome P450 [Halenospora varia]
MIGRAQLFKGEIKESVEIFVQQMDLLAGQSLDISYWAFYWSFDVTFSLIFGCEFGYMKSQSDFNGWIFSFKTITGYAAMLGQIPEICAFTLGNDRVMSFMRKFQTFPNPTQQSIAEVGRRIKKHDSEPHICDKTFICKVLAGRNSTEDQEIQHAEAMNILFETFFAAAAGIAVTLGAVFFCLLTNRDAYERLVPILRAPVPSQPQHEIALEKLAYLVPHYMAYRDVNIFGEDVEVFKPESWLEADESTLRKMENNFLASPLNARK